MRMVSGEDTENDENFFEMKGGRATCMEKKKRTNVHRSLGGFGEK